MVLTPAQMAFCRNYIGRGKIARLHGASAIVQQLSAIVIPADATPEETAEIRAHIQAGRSLIDDSTVDKELKRAKIEADEAYETVATSVARIVAATDRAALQNAQAGGLPATVDLDANEADQQSISDEAARIVALAVGAPVPQVLATIDADIAQLQSDIAALKRFLDGVREAGLPE